mmetsp:Transcript_34034/g.57787  ORF Transcript_34034/g.57787 Transcript_34034/m.57787 type:complete len:126 (+) Transcript_34034:835-1212(+)
MRGKESTTHVTISLLNNAWCVNNIETENDELSNKYLQEVWTETQKMATQKQKDATYAHTQKATNADILGVQRKELPMTLVMSNEEKFAHLGICNLHTQQKSPTQLLILFFQQQIMIITFVLYNEQ